MEFQNSFKRSFQGILVVFLVLYMQNVSAKERKRGFSSSEEESQSPSEELNKDQDASLIPPKPKDIRFYLYTKGNRHHADELFINDEETLNSSSYIAGAVLKVVTHGYTSSYKFFPTSLKDEYLKHFKEELNVILVDWAVLAKGPNYADAVSNTVDVAYKTAHLISFLISKNVAHLNKIHILGHSLGAQTSGRIGLILKNTVGKVSRITGFDAAGPLYQVADMNHRLDASNAEFVDVIHTSGFSAGLFKPIGHVDFYVNGGISQPGCTTDIGCNHGRSYEIYKESISNPVGFKACKCEMSLFGYPILLFNSCKCENSDSIAFMGEYLSHRTRGIYSLSTNAHSPYAKY